MNSFISQRYSFFLITDVKMHHTKKIKSLETVVSSSSTSSASSTESLEKKKEVEEYIPTNWQIMKLCEPEKWWMVAGIIAAIAVGSSFPTFAILFGETYGVCYNMFYNIDNSRL